MSRDYVVTKHVLSLTVDSVHLARAVQQLRAWFYMRQDKDTYAAIVVDRKAHTDNTVIKVVRAASWDDLDGRWDAVLLRASLYWRIDWDAPVNPRTRSRDPRAPDERVGIVAEGLWRLIEDELKELLVANRMQLVTMGETFYREEYPESFWSQPAIVKG